MLNCISHNYVVLIVAAIKAEQKIVQDLLNSGLCQNEEQFQRKILEWDRTLEDLNRKKQEFVRINIKGLF